ncbi:hypothetical protein HZI73_25230 [Vallitalea pronyensis]|uniref:Uncharacterized protein n=1 Tax=Vallitalea pronyensis TaxID=1348613 RepID=A0A8J8MQ66_9FIRM|nr:hypothetical protein [Vallitalea pronyensis]QUI25398.1 hypothetical protein HZI73_25230 [Vallitalea pronyensis]
MADINEHFSFFASQMLAEAYKEFSRTDLEYQEIECYLNVHSKKFYKILSSLSKEDREFTEEYISKQSLEANCANESLYIAGYMDCVKLLKEIGVLS